MKISEILIEETHVYSSIKHAETLARRTGGKIVLTVGGYFKVVPRDALGTEVEPVPDLNQRRQEKQKEIEELAQKILDLRQPLLNRNKQWYEKEWRVVDRSEKLLSKLRAELNQLKSVKSTYRIKDDNIN